MSAGVLYEVLGIPGEAASGGGDFVEAVASQPVEGGVAEGGKVLRGVAVVDGAAVFGGRRVSPIQCHTSTGNPCNHRASSSDPRLHITSRTPHHKPHTTAVNMVDRE
jgi:hypothetical protein